MLQVTATYLEKDIPMTLKGAKDIIVFKIHLFREHDPAVDSMC